MASPPRTMGNWGPLSPPFSASPQLPSSQKRPGSVLSKEVKRRKQSAMSISSAGGIHPLRQTSFPPDDPNFDARSPSVDTMSMVSGSIADSKVGTKRRAKGKKAGKNKDRDDATSLVGGRALTVASGVSAGGTAQGAPVAEEDDSDDETEEKNAVAVVARTKEEKEKEKKYRAMLVEAFDKDQFHRYEVWRGSRLADAVVRRLINQTLSQSVPASIIIAVKSIGKVFVGDVIERAREIQDQYLAVTEESQTKQWEINSEGVREIARPTQRDRARRGPLKPEHLREALRRYKLERDGGFVGQMGLGRLQHVIGDERWGLKSLGKRLLR